MGYHRKKIGLREENDKNPIIIYDLIIFYYSNVFSTRSDEKCLLEEKALVAGRRDSRAKEELLI